MTVSKLDIYDVEPRLCWFVVHIQCSIFVILALNAYFLTKSAKYEWERYQRYNRIREMRVQRNSTDIVQNENERN